MNTPATLEQALQMRVPVSVTATQRSYNTVSLPHVNGLLHGQPVCFGGKSISSRVR